ncbi:substrate-binding domain-containing protein [Pararhizobium sp.]|uniref:substrate-binding domain-containing protein n=1 Tax=Pararhizobium sp. TaxID=1977563 RepID=UPI0027162432|nr:substrate-binding domain-containing protein [Pararhizobium sp.]MDO9418468.1 substrate-binding domain-containing protein [Pararhizobium sp.]
MLVDEISTSNFFAPLLDGAQAEADGMNCIISVFRTRSETPTEKAAIEALRSSKLVGIVYTTLIRQVVEMPESLKGIPAVLLNCATTTHNEFSVIPADVAGAYAATEHLLKAGHRRIAHLTESRFHVAARDREAGYRQALTDWDIAIDKNLIRVSWVADNRSYTDTMRLLDLPNPPTAIFCFYDRLATGVYRAIQERGLRIPEDISVVGYDNEPRFAEYLVPPLTSVQLPHEEMGRQAVRMLLDYEQLRASSQLPRLRKIECPLVERLSVAPARTGTSA